MNLHEYQGKELLSKFGVNIQRGIVIENLSEVEEAGKKIAEMSDSNIFVVKAQIHAGGRGKGGGVKVAKNMDELISVCKKILGMQLITPQTGKEGKKVNKVLIAEDVYYPGKNEPDEFYMSVLLNRSNGQNMIMYSTEGGMDIEKVAEQTPDLIFYENIDPMLGLQSFQARKIAFNLGLSGNAFKEMTKFVQSLYTAYIGIDASLFEINPVLKTSNDNIIAVDSKVTLDNNALFRHKDFETLRDLSDCWLEQKGRRPRGLIVRLGKPADYTARVVFAKNYMAIGGIETQEIDADSTSVEKTIKEENIDLLIICSSDRVYEETLESNIVSLRSMTSKMIVLAGGPRAEEISLYELGLDKLIYSGDKILDTLQEIAEEIGLIKP